MAPAGASSSAPGTKPAASAIDNCWAVPVVAALAGFLIVIPQSNNGIFYILFVDELGASREYASWPKTIASASANFMGILVWLVQHRISISSVLIIAAFICPLSIIVSSLVTNITWMSLTWGFLYGSSSGILVIGTSVLVVSYFDQYRSLSTGITFVGRDLSGILGPSLLTWLISTYAFKGTLLVLGGLILHTVPLVLMLRHPHPLTLPAWKRCCTHQNQEKTEAAYQGGTETKRGSENTGNTCFFQRRKDCRRDTTGKPCNRVEAIEDLNKTALCSVVGRNCQNYMKGPSNRTAQNKKISEIFFQALSLLYMPSFYVLLVTMAALDFNFPVLTSTIVDYSRDKRLPQHDATQVTSLISFGNLCGNVLIPAISDKIVRNRCSVAVLASTLSALCFIVMPHLQSFASVGAVTFVAGVQTGYLRTLKAVLLADYLGVDNVALSWGAMGIAALPLVLSEPSIVGMFRDNGGSYDNLYRTCAAIDLLAALLLSAQACLDAKKSMSFRMTETKECK